MTEAIMIVDATKLAASLGLGAPSVQQVVDWTNDLVTDEWLYPQTPVPPRIQMVGYAVATRALDNPKGLESKTLSHDETSRTERYPKEMQRAGIYLTDDEVALLQRNPSADRRRARRFRTIRTSPGY